jgi:endonuclease/exonuclease/phosphatase family metal-dependent hydrolase
MKSFSLKVIALSILSIVCYAQNQYKIMSYNLLNYPGTDSAIRNPYFRTVIANTTPDILVVQEILSQAGVNGFVNNVLNVASSGYAAGTFLDGPDTDNAIFYKTSSFTFLANNVITTSLRNINEFILAENTTGDTLRIYSVHLKAGTAASDQQQRLAEVTSLRNVTDNLTSNSNFIVCGDFNIYSSSETAYQKLKDATTPGCLVDIFNLTGTWNNQAYAQYHTQSPRTRQFNGGSTGGMDDRFDMILFSQAVMDSGNVFYVPGSFINYGNDGNHYNDSINRPPNNVVSQQIADALHYSSDHIPVFVTLKFDQENILQSTVNLADGWNILSVPLLASDMGTTVLFPTAISPFYSFNATYSQVSVLEKGKGYWAKFNGNQNVIISGTNSAINEISVNQGWNLIGPFEYDVNIENITTDPPNIIISSFYGYEGGYTPSTVLKPGKGYWVKCDLPGHIILNFN